MECLKSFRAAQGLTRKQMAERLGVSKSMNDKVEYSDREPSRNFLNRFKEAFPNFDMNLFFDTELHET